MLLLISLSILHPEKDEYEEYDAIILHGASLRRLCHIILVYGSFRGPLLADASHSTVHGSPSVTALLATDPSRGYISRK